ncbi:hypothetical protein Acid345_2050 [Candidatus Koribacter versatilis Ellin345]|uniref:Uncharacterized protein n=1 Tax=Koribacter versatilis (strain Ellin345) TaxID=204669 RepID=Q1IPZ9_KORVE|nr:hypothetical protein [Candidatus Koribacter versatilis]ABF41051.1 hypothetical protein Acid345_2050 [Candidatus Koribacter versatilis Ellin345]
MKPKLISVLSLMLLLAPLSLFAASKNSQSVTFSRTITVGGTTIPAGDYKVQWDGTGNVTANIVRGKKVLATVPATVTGTKSNYDGALHFDGDTLQGILFKNATLEFNGSSAASASGH